MMIMRRFFVKFSLVMVSALGLGLASLGSVQGQEAAKVAATQKAKSAGSELIDAQRRIDRLEAQIAEMQSMIGALQTLVQKGVAQNPVQTTVPFQQRQPEKVLTDPEFKTDGWGADTRSDRERDDRGQRDDIQLSGVPGADLELNGRVPESKVSINGEPARKLYDAGYNYLMASNYTSAEATFRSFLSNYPQNDLSGNAQYWLGETYFARGDYRKAANEFLTGYKTYRNNQKAPDNLLKLGMSLHRLGQSEAACQTYSELKGKYKSLPGHVSRRLGEEQSKAGCS